MRFCMTILAAAVLLAACSPSDRNPAEEAQRPHRAFRFVYSAVPAGIPEGAGRIRMWIPVPVSLPDQTIRDVRLELTVSGTSANGPLEEMTGLQVIEGTKVDCAVNPIRNGLGRSLCVTTEGEPCGVRLSFDVTRYESRGGGRISPAELQEALLPDRMVPLGGKVSDMAGSFEDRGDPMEMGRILYEHTLERMRYDKPVGGEWGRGDSEWACDSRYGNCTDFHSYFMALMRTKGIPTRFEIGFPIPTGTETEAEIGGYHCWVFFNGGEERGWVPVDISEADKRPEMSDYFFGKIDENRVTFTGGRDLELDPSPASGALNFFVYPHVEVNGEVWQDVDRSFSCINKS